MMWSKLAQFEYASEREERNDEKKKLWRVRQ